MSVSLKGKVAIVTGASQGLGLEISRAYLRAGASLIMCARNGELLEEAGTELRAGFGGNVATIPADVSDRDDAQRLAAGAMELHGRIDILVNNAGIYGPMGPIEEIDWAKWVEAIEVNLLGSVLMCRAVLPAMKDKGKGKIIQLSGGGATNPMPNISAYAVSKAAIVRFAETLGMEVARFNIDVNAIAPGALNTRMLDEVLAARPARVGDAFFDKSVKQKEGGGAGFAAGVDLALFLASDASDGITGKLISAVWDDLARWPEHLEELRKSDAYTLRRIARRDRDLPWGGKGASASAS